VREDTMDYVGAGSGPYKRCLAADVSGTKQVHFLGYDAQYDERLGVDRLRSQAIVPIKEKEVSKVSGARYKPFEVKFVKEESELPAAFGTPEVSGRDASFHLEKRCIETVVRKDHDVASSKKSEQAATPPLAAVTKFSQLPSVATWMMRNPSKPSEKTVAEALPVPNLILTSPPERKAHRKQKSSKGKSPRWRREHLRMTSGDTGRHSARACHARLQELRQPERGSKPWMSWLSGSRRYKRS